MLEFIIELLRFIASQLDQLDPRLSSAILGTVVLVLVVFIWGRKFSEPPAAPMPTDAARREDHLDEVQSLRDEVTKLSDIIKTRERLGPHFSPVEHIYFNTNGIINAIFVLIAAVLIFEYKTLADRVLQGIAVPAAQKPLVTEIIDRIVSNIRGEVGLLMATLAATVVLCCLLVMIGRIKRGHSFEIINRSFQLSLLVAIAAFAAFALPLSFPS